VKWNSDKHYLRDLAEKGVPTVLTKFVEPDQHAERQITELLSQPDVGEFVVKPAVGAGSRDASAFGREEREDAARHAQRMLNDKRSVLLQPYLSNVDRLGETALLYFEGEFSHAIRKGPLLKRKEGPTTELFAKETISARVPDAAELRVGALALQSTPFETPCTRGWI
jgi:O-ureido-D-serine cyclo-ligase